MDILKKYSIAYKGLSVGKHFFEFELNDLFFKAFEDSQILSGNGVVRIELNKSNSMIELVFDIEANVGVECEMFGRGHNACEIQWRADCAILRDGK